MKSIDRQAFSGADALSEIYYSADAAAWGKIAIAEGNDPLGKATFHYNGDIIGEIPAPAMTDVILKLNDKKEVMVSWSYGGNPDNVSHFILMRSEDGTEYREIRRFQASSKEYTDNPMFLGKETAFYYKLVVVDLYGRSAEGNARKIKLTSDDKSAPVARITFSGEDISLIKEELSFSGRNSTDDEGISSYTWDFGDGTTGSTKHQHAHFIGSS